MSDFYDTIDEYLGDADALTDINIVVRRLYFYDFQGIPVRMWQGKGKLFTTDGKEWLGSIDQGGTDHHTTPNIQDGRDGTSANYTFAMKIPDYPGYSSYQIYEELKAQQSLVYNRYLTVYLAIFNEGEALRPQTPIVYFKQLVMQSPTFSESMAFDSNNVMKRTYTVSIVARDANVGRSNTPNRTYADTAQKEYAKQLGYSGNDKGCEFLAALSNKTFTVS